MALDHGITKQGEGYQSTAWNVVGHTYTPKVVSESVFVWHAVIPADTFVPPHIHPTQEEWITMLTGSLEIEFGSDVQKAGPGDVVRMPRGVAHGIFNRSGAEATCVFGVAPARRLFDLFGKLHNVTDPEELVRISAEHEVNFLPPPPA
ncbi:MAG: cupin domain-containing protein [Pseudomonadota bacterium]